MTKSENLYNELNTPDTSKKKLTTLKNIKKACDKLSSKYSKLNAATVGKFCENSWGTPKEQSIRNNAEYMKYIRAREEEREKIESKAPQEVEVLVQDQVAQAIINALKMENKNLRASIHNIGKGIRQISPIDIDKFIAENIKLEQQYRDLLTDKPNETEALIDNQKIEEAISEIVKALNENLIEKYCDLSIDYKNGTIFNKNTGLTYWTKQTQLKENSLSQPHPDREELSEK